VKPLLLTFGGFGAFPGEVSIDFTELDELGLFLVVGKTGAGKSTIFDAMTFALYGRPANGRSASVLVSDHKDRVKPHVEFEFALGSRRFRVSRILDVGTTAAAPGKQKFEVLDPSGNSVSTVTGKKNVTTEIENLLGLDADQFFKVVMIPQGDFQDFLIAKDEEKEKLLKALFGTSLYQAIAQKLVDQAAIKVRAVEESRREQIRLRVDARNAIEEIPDEIAIEELPDPDEDLPGVITIVKGAADAAGIEASRRDEEWKEAHAALTTANSEAERFDASAKLAKLKKEQSSGAKDVVVAEKALEAHKNAEVVAPHIDTLAEKQGDLAEAEKELADAQKTMKKLFSASIMGAPVFAALRGLGVDSPPATLLRAVEKASGAVDKAEELIDEIDGARGDQKLHKADLVTVEGEIKDATSRRKKLEALRPKLELELKTTRTLASKFETLGLKVDALDQQLDDADVDSAIALAKAKKKAFDTAVKRQDEAKLAYDVALAKKTLFLAGELADSLIDGEACPVCGSDEHPAPAKPGGGYSAATVAEEVDRKERAHIEAGKKSGEARSELTRAEAEIEEAKSAKKKLPKEADQRALRAELAAAEKAAESLEDLDEGFGEFIEALNGVTDELRAGEQRRKELKKDIDSATKRITDATKKLSDIVESSDLVKAQTLCESLDEAVTELTIWTERRTNAQSSVTTAQKSLDGALKKSGFANLGAATKAILDLATVKSHEEVVTGSSKRDQEIQKLTGAVGEKAVPKKRPDVVTLQKSADSAQEQQKQSRSAKTQLDSVLKRLKKVSAYIDRIGYVR